MALSASYPADGCEFGTVHGQERNQHGDVTSRVHKEAGGRTEGRDHTGRNGGSNQPSRIHQSAVETHGISNEVSSHHLLDEGLTGGNVEHVGDAEGQREDKDLPDLGVVSRDQETQDQGRQSGR